MNLPTGVVTTSITFSEGSSPLGNAVTATATITPVFPGTTRLVWLATGQALFPLVETLQSESGSDKVIKLPAVDQDGWVDERGNAYKNWHYIILVRYEVNGDSLEVVRTFQPTTADPVIDFDLIFDTGTSDPIIVIKQPVRSVNGYLPDDSGNVVVPLSGGDGSVGSVDGREVVLRTTSTHIQWTYEGQDVWNDLIALEELKGSKGDQGNVGNTGPAGPASNVRLLPAGATSGPTTDPAGTIWGYRK